MGIGFSELLVHYINRVVDWQYGILKGESEVIVQTGDRIFFVLICERARRLALQRLLSPIRSISGACDRWIALAEF